MRIDSPEQLQALMGTPYSPSAQQWAAISAPLEPGVVIAGAGSGKTTLMAARVVYLVATGQVAPDQVLGLTFTTKAAAELAVRIRSALVAADVLPGATSDSAAPPDEEDGEVLEPTVATYNAYASGLLVDHGLRIGFEPDTRVLADATRFQLAGRVVQRYRGDVQELTDHPPTVVANLLALDGQLSEHLVTPGQVRDHDQRCSRLFEAAASVRATAAIEKALNTGRRRGELLGLVEDYRRAKRELGLMDFSEQIELAARLTEEHPEVGAAERARFRVVLLDEYQDTSVAQARMLSALFSGPTPESGLGHPVTAVGDPNQAIYGWRGASVSNIVRFADAFPPARAPLALTVSRRSQARILDVVNDVAARLYESVEAVSPLEPASADDAGVVEASLHPTKEAELSALVAGVGAAHRRLAADRDEAWRHIAVLTRDNGYAAEAFLALTEQGIPVEIVGLDGLLRVPEVAEVVAVLQLIGDVTANSALLTLLAGPRWAVGPRDLALLGARAAELAGRRPDPAKLNLQEGLAAGVEGTDPIDVPALGDALEDPGDRGYSTQARERFALLAAELRSLRSYVGEPLLDLVRRVIDVTGIDVELASSLSASAPSRRDNLDAFVKVVADFDGVDGDTSLSSLLGYLRAEDEDGNGLAVATPTAADSVKLLTVHRAKGLEWDTVFVVGVARGKFPSERGRTLWVTSPAVLPAGLRGDGSDQPQLAGYDKAGIDAYRGAVKAFDAMEELRLAYVALTRAATHLSLSAYWWGDTQRPLGPSAVLARVREIQVERGWPLGDWASPPAEGEVNPRLAEPVTAAWPRPALDEDAPPDGLTGAHAEARRRLDAVRRVQRAAADLAAGVEEAPPEDLTVAARLDDWDLTIERLVAEARASRPDRVEVPMPTTLSATSMARLRGDPDGFARELARPMPRPPSPAARFGTRFHAWVEQRFGQQGLIDLEDIPGRGDTGIDDDDDLRRLTRAFERGPFGDRTPYRIEQPFALVLGHGTVLRGRIDAVYADDDGWLVVDWKTGRTEEADPLQLAIYRQAWAELVGADPVKVRAGFYYVRTDRLVTFDDLPGRPELAAILPGG